MIKETFIFANHLIQASAFLFSLKEAISVLVQNEKFHSPSSEYFYFDLIDKNYKRPRKQQETTAPIKVFK